MNVLKFGIALGLLLAVIGCEKPKAEWEPPVMIGGTVEEVSASCSHGIAFYIIIKTAKGRVMAYYSNDVKGSPWQSAEVGKYISVSEDDLCSYFK